MGWWKQNEAGESFAEGGELEWGDGPADLMDGALARIVAEFEKDLGRRPTPQELLSGVKFSLGGAGEDAVAMHITEVEAERPQKYPPAPVFEDATSPLTRTNDGQLVILPQRDVGPTPGWIVVDEADSHVELFTMKREVADAFVAGWDYRARREAEEPVPADADRPPGTDRSWGEA